MKPVNRRRFFKTLGAVGTLGVLSCPVASYASSRRSIGRVVVIGGGFAGATAAKYLRRLDQAIDVALVEPKSIYYTCPFSNTVVAGWRSLGEIAQGYTALRDIHGVDVIHDTATRIEPDRRTVVLNSGRDLRYDRVVVAPGIGFKWGTPEGYDQAASRIMPHAWDAGPQTTLLRERLVAMQDGGTVGIAIPAAPFRCPPGPYERASLIAGYLKKYKPRSKVLLLDGNETFSKQALFTQAWETLYPGMIDRISLADDGAVQRVEVGSSTLFTHLDDYKVDVANVIPPQHAGVLARDSGLADNTGWCPVDHKTFESKLIPGIHVLGDACRAGQMPKSGSSANSQAKNCALALVAYLNGDQPGEPSYHNTCYSLISEDYGISVTMIYRLEDGVIRGVEGAGGVSSIDADRRYRAAEAYFARGWYASITSDTFM